VQTVLYYVQKTVEVAPFVAEIVIALGLIIFVHELGHFMTAKWFGVRVRRFALGMGPIIVKWVRGETEYSLRWVPIGGFVDLVGEHPEAEEADDPRGLWRRPAWQRIVVFSAGVVMNALLALVFFALAPIVGIQAIVPVAGGVMQGAPAEKAGLLPGDRILSIDGHRVEAFDDLLLSVALCDAGTSFDLEVERPAAGAEPPKVLHIDVASIRPPDSMFPMLGIDRERSTVIAAFASPAALLRQAGAEEGDRILAVNGKNVATWRDLTKALADAPAGPVALKIDRKGAVQDLRVVPADLKVYDYGLTPPTEIGSAPEPGSPAAEAGIRAGDRIAAVQGKAWPSVDELIDAVKAAGNAGEVRLTLWRDGKTLDVACKTVILPGADHPRIGIAPRKALDKPAQIGAVEPGGPAAEAGLKPGDIVVAAGDNEQTVDDWGGLAGIIIAAGGKPLTLQANRGGTALPTTVRPKALPQDRLTVTDVAAEPLYAPLPRIYNPIAAAQRGVWQTVLWFGRVYVNLKQFASGQVSTKAMGGPVLIAQVAVSLAGHGVGTFMDFLGMLTVSIAVLNFLPIPPFDGGHVLFVLIDAIIRKPVSMKLRTIVWIVGWVAVGLLFIVVTYRDIVRVITQRF